MYGNEWHTVTEEKSSFYGGDCQENANDHQEGNAYKVSVLLLEENKHLIQKHASSIFIADKYQLSEQSK